MQPGQVAAAATTSTATTSTTATAVATQYAVSFAGNVTSVAAGVPIAVYVVPETASGADVSNYTGTAGFTSSDLAAALPANTTFPLPTATNISGIRVIVTFNTPGTQTVHATDTSNASITGSASITVTPAAVVPVATQFGITIMPYGTAGIAATSLTSVAQGTEYKLVITPEDANGNPVTNYAGTVRFSSSDAKAVLPGNITFTPSTSSGTTEYADAVVTFNTVGSQTLTVTDNSNEAIYHTSTVTVTQPTAAVATKYAVSFAANATSVAAGVPIAVYVVPETAAGANVINYTGTAGFTSSDLAALLPPNTTFTLPASGSVSGIRVLVTFNTTGTQSITATDTSNVTITGSASITVTPAAVIPVATQFGVTIMPLTPSNSVAAGLTSVVAGTQYTVVIVPEDANGNPVTNYAGTVRFSSSDTKAVLPGNVTFTPSTTASGTEYVDAVVTFNTAGTQTLTVTDTANEAIYHTLTVTVTQPITAVAAKYAVSFAANATSVAAGTPIAVYVIPETAAGANVTNYTGTAGFTSSDLAALLPPNTTFTLPASGGVSGIRVLVTFNTTGTQSITATDTSNAAITGSASISVTPAPVVPVATQFGVTIMPYGTAGTAATSLTSVTAGTQYKVVITPEDASGNPVTNYAGTVRFSSSDAKAVLPGNITLTPSTAAGSTEYADAVVTFNTTGTQTLTVTDTGNEAIYHTSTVTVTPAVAPVATKYAVSFAANAASVAAGTPIAVYVIPETAAGANVTNYTGTAGFTSSDLAALLPPNTTFTLPTSANVSGIRVLVTFNTPGTQSITATDTSNATITGSASITVTPAAVVPVATQFGVTVMPYGIAGTAAASLTSVTAGTQYKVVITPEDASGHPVTNYAGTVWFSSSDGKALLPGNITFTPTTSGSPEYYDTLVTFNTTGTQTLTAQDTSNEALLGSASVTVAPAPVATQFSVKFATTSATGVTVGTPLYAYVVPEDANGNAVSNYSGTVHFTSPDTAAVLPGDYTFTPVSGSEEYARVQVTFNTPGSEVLTATDTVSPSITGTSTGTTINAFQNPVNPLDVLGTGGAIVPGDALAVINYLNANPGGALPATPSTTTDFLDVTGSGRVVPADALLIINYLNDNPGGVTTAAVTTAAVAPTPAAVAASGVVTVQPGATAAVQPTALVVSTSPASPQTATQQPAAGVDVAGSTASPTLQAAADVSSKRLNNP